MTDGMADRTIMLCIIVDKINDPDNPEKKVN